MPKTKKNYTDMSKTTLIVLIIMAITMFTNPNRKEHAICLFQCRDDERGLLVLEQSTIYNNYIFFSTAEQAELKSFGFLGQISVSRKKDR